MADESKVFSLVGQGLKLDSKADIQPHLEKLEQITDLEEVHLGGNTLGVDACQALADVLKNKKTLKVADFADIFTGRLITEIPDALRALCDALTDHTSLVEINLSDNAFGGRSAEPMVNFLKNNHSFSVLKLNNNGLGITGGTIVAEALYEAAQNLNAKGLQSNLRTVICGRNRLENGSAPVWAKAYAAHSGLFEVRMFQNGIRMEGIEAISKGLASCPNLEVLDLQDNTATLRGSRAIAACLPKWPKLKTLNLSDCLLKPKGGALVFGALANGSNPALETIQVQYCDLDRKVLHQLGGAIELHLISLTKLDINGNWADEEDECIEKIKSALAKHGHEDALLELDEMDPDGEESEGEEEEEADEEEEDADKEVSKPAAPETQDETDELAAALSKTSLDNNTRAKTSDAQNTKARAPEKTAVAAQPDVPAAEEATAAPTAVEPEATNELATEQVTATSGDATSAHGTPTDPAVDLSGELYSKDAATTSAPAQGAVDAPKKKRAFRAAWGAIRELLK
ncbi:hypothetical protein NDA13_005889 [Ustilago tritici]|nr:hypothetical protein NDA13_005889 [Ustilago tritici]